MQKVSRWAIIIATLFLSCRTRTVIPKKDMVSILAKIYITDATVAEQSLRNKYFEKDTIDYYGRTIRSFGYSPAQFDSSLKYYSLDPKEIDAIYDKVIIELSKLETKIDAINISRNDSIAKDSLVNLWSMKSAWEIPSDGKRSTIDFEIPVEKLGTYTVSADVKIYPDDQSVDPSMTAYFYFDDKSKNGNRSEVTSKYYQKMAGKQKVSIQLELKNSLVTHIKGSLLWHRNTDTIFIKHADVSNIKVLYKPFLKKKLKPLRKETIKNLSVEQ